MRLSRRSWLPVGARARAATLLGLVGLCALCALGWSPPALVQAQHLSGGPGAMLPSVLVRPVAPRRGYRIFRWSLPLARVELDLRRLPTGRGVRRTLTRTHAKLVVNAGFFDSHGHTLGLSVAKGRQHSPYSARLGGGVVTVRRGVAELHSAVGFETPEDTEFALQAKPRLVVDGEALPMHGVQVRADRTGLCLRDEGRTLDIVVARSRHPNGHGGPTLRQFARALEAMGCEAALNLDGGRSTAAAWRHRGRLHVLPPRDVIRQVIVVRARPLVTSPG